MQQDNLAPVSVVPTVIRSPQLKKWNTASHVVSEFGGYNGLSSFVLIPDCTHVSPLDFKGREKELAQCQKLVFERRPDIAAQYAQRAKGLSDMTYALTEDPVCQESIDAAREGSSFVSLHDATEGWKFSVFKDGETNLELKKTSCLTHPCSKSDSNCIGHAAINLPFTKKGNRVVKSFITSIVNCPQLFSHLVAKTNTSHNPVHKTLNEVLQATVKSRSMLQSKCARFTAALIRAGTNCFISH
jgi:hypothetical protein